jgi:CheY-like chemotaxis protein
MSDAPHYGNVLLVDTNLFFVKLLSEQLRLQGFDVIHCPEPAYALTAVEWNMPVAILCATNYPDGGCFSVPAILYADAKTRHIPVIAIGDGEQTLLEAFRAGFHDFLDRRQGAQELAGHLFSFLLSRHNGFQPTQMLGHADTTLSGRLSAVDLAGVIQMLVQSRQTGALHINAGSDGIVFFKSGEIVHAECGAFTGDAAIVDLIQQCYGAGDGVYKFVPASSTTERTVKNEVTGLILDALRMMDEQNQSAENKEEVPS